MAISNSYQQIFNGGTSSVGEITTITYSVHPAAQNLGLYILSTVVAGTLDVDAQLSNGAWVEVVTNTAIAANTVMRQVVSIGARAIRARFTPTAATASNLTIDGFYNGYGQPA